MIGRSISKRRGTQNLLIVHLEIESVLKMTQKKFANQKYASILNILLKHTSNSQDVVLSKTLYVAYIINDT